MNIVQPTSQNILTPIVTNQNMIKIITSKTEWEAALDEIQAFDFYHSYDYHQISKSQQEDAVLVCYKNQECIILLPLLLRKIFDTVYYDATSVYGYAGPLSKRNACLSELSHFHKELKDYFLEHKIIAVFSRLNPYIADQEDILEGMGTVNTIGNVVNIDLTKSLEEQRSAYRRDTRSRVNKARRLCSIKMAEKPEDIAAFIEIYTATMKKLEANASYFFDEEYFFNFLKCDGFQTDILLAVHDETGDITAGSMFVKTNDIIQYHLSGTHPDYMRIAPSRLLLDEMRIRGTEEGYTYFNLGGGYQSQEDALFNFKSSFSEDIKPFKVWNFTVNQDKYDEFVAISKVDKNTGFFPAYRAPS